MTDQPSDKSFVQSWIEAEKNSHADSEILKAIDTHTTKDELDEAKLLAALKAMGKSGGEEDA